MLQSVADTGYRYRIGPLGGASFETASFTSGLFRPMALRKIARLARLQDRLVSYCRSKCPSCRSKRESNYANFGHAEIRRFTILGFNHHVCKAIFCAICVLVAFWSVATETRSAQALRGQHFTGGPDSQAFGFEHLTIADSQCSKTGCPRRRPSVASAGIGEEQSTSRYRHLDAAYEGPRQASPTEKTPKTRCAFR